MSDYSIQVRLSILQFVQFLIWGSWFVTAGTYMLQTLGFDGRQVGLVYANTAIAASVSPILLGIVADKYLTPEKLLTVLHLIGAALLVLLPSLQDFLSFYVVVLVYLLCFLPTFSLTNSLCFHHVADAQQDFPRIRVWGTISWIVAGLLVSYLDLETSGAVFYIAAGFSLLTAVYALTLPRTPIAEEAPPSFLASVLSPDIKALFRDRSFSVMMVSIALIAIPCAYYYSFVNPFLTEMGVRNAAGKMAIGQVTEILMLLALPWFLSRWRLRTIIFIGLLFWGVRYALLIVGIGQTGEGLYMLSIGMHGVAYIFGMVAAQIYLDTKVPTHLRSTAQGFFSFLTLGLMAFVGTYIAGERVSFYTAADGSHVWSSIWIFPAVAGVATALFFYLFFAGQTKVE